MQDFQALTITLCLFVRLKKAYWNPSKRQITYMYILESNLLTYVLNSKGFIYIDVKTLLLVTQLTVGYYKATAFCNPKLRTGGLLKKKKTTIFF